MVDERSSARVSAQSRLLVVLDSDPQCIRGWLEQWDAADFEILYVASIEEALRETASGDTAAILLDLTRPEESGLEPMIRAREVAASVPIVVVTRGEEDTRAVAARRFGAQDAVAIDSCDGPSLSRSIRHAVERHRVMLELRLARQREHHLANHDSLTGMLNRASFADEISRSLAHARRYHEQVAVLFLDLDRFQAINDTLGHPAGDELLRQCAQRLHKMTRCSDVVARVGGDEFLVLLNDVKTDHAAAKAAEKLIEQLAPPFMLQGREYSITASVGIALLPENGATADALIRNAETAMVHAKDCGRNRYRFYSEAMNASVATRLHMENSLRRAVDNCELFLSYQPQVDAMTGLVAGVAAVTHWCHPQLGVIASDEMAALAEGSGLRSVISAWAMVEACKAAARWLPGRGPAPRVSVGISHFQLGQEEFVDIVSRALRQSGLPANRLELELIEDATGSDRGVLRTTLQSLRELGVSVSIGQFGRGHSPLAALKELPVTGLRVDRSIVVGVAHDTVDRTIATAVVTMARSLGLQVVAEGVETAEQRDFLLEVGCTQMLGDLFGKPLDEAALRQALASSDAPWDEALAHSR